MSKIRFRDYQQLKALFADTVHFETMSANRRTLTIEYRVFADDRIQGYFDAVYLSDEGFDSGLLGDWVCLKS